MDIIRRTRSIFRPFSAQGPSKKSLAAALCALLFYSTVASPLAEANFWEERRSVSRSSAQNNPGRANSLSSRDYQLLAQLPTGQIPLGLPETLNGSTLAPSLAPLSAHDLSENVKWAKNGIVPAWLSRLVLPYGSVREIHLAKSDSPLIIHIQDIHGAYDAQKNIARILQGLKDGRGVKLVGLEGAEGYFEMEKYKALPEAGKEMNQQLADYFLEEGYVGGAEYLGLVSEVAPLLWGVETGDLYADNTRAVLSAQDRRREAEEFLSGLAEAVSGLKEKIYSPGLKEFDRFYQTFQAGKTGLGAYVDFLSSRADAGAYPNVALLSRAIRWEKKLDFKKVERERLDLIDRLVSRLSRESLDELVRASVEYRAGQRSYGEYYAYMRDLCREKNIDLTGYPQLSDYMTYVQSAERINRDKLLDELERMEKTVEAGLTFEPAQKELAGLGRDQALLTKLLRTEMTPRHWADYTERRPLILNMADRARSLSSGSPAFPAIRAELLKPFEDFCRLALARNEALTENLLRKMKEEKQTSAVLVTGGFHTEGMTALWRRKNASYVVVTPKVENIDQAKNYMDIFSRDPLPIEKIFAGEPISLIFARFTSPGLIRRLAEPFQRRIQAHDFAVKANALAATVEGSQARWRENKLPSGERRKNLRALIEKAKAWWGWSIGFGENGLLIARPGAPSVVAEFPVGGADSFQSVRFSPPRRLSVPWWKNLWGSRSLILSSTKAYYENAVKHAPEWLRNPMISHKLLGYSVIEEAGLAPAASARKEIEARGQPTLTRWRAFWMGRAPGLILMAAWNLKAVLLEANPLLLAIVMSFWLVAAVYYAAHQASFVFRHENKSPVDFAVRLFAVVLFNLAALAAPRLFLSGFDGPLYSLLAMVIGFVLAVAVHTGWNKIFRRFPMTMGSPWADPSLTDLLNEGRGLTFVNTPRDVEALDVRLREIVAANGNIPYLRLTLRDDTDLDDLLNPARVINGRFGEAKSPLLQLIERGGVLFLDYTNSDPKTVAGFNQLFGDSPEYLGVKASPSLRIVGAVREDQLREFSVDFYSRSLTGEFQADADYADPLEGLSQVDDPEAFNGLRAELFESDDIDIKDALVARYRLLPNGSVRWEEGALVRAMREGRPLLIQGGVWRDEQGIPNTRLSHMVRQALLNGGILSNGKWVAAREGFSVHWAEGGYGRRALENKRVVPAGETAWPAERAWVLNRETQHQLFEFTRIDSQGTLSQGAGLLERMGADGGRLRVLITDPEIPESLWHRLLHMGGELEIELGVGVEVPLRYRGMLPAVRRTRAPDPESWEMARDRRVSLVEGSDPSGLLARIMRDVSERNGQPPLVYPVTPATILDDLSMASELLPGGRLRAVKRQVLEALERGETVVLAGMESNPDLLRQLETALHENPYLVVNGEVRPFAGKGENVLTGRLILLSHIGSGAGVSVLHRAVLDISVRDIVEELKREFSGALTESDIEKVLSLRRAFETVPPPARRGLYPARADFSLGRLRLLCRQARNPDGTLDWMRAFEDVYLDDYADDPNVAAFLRTAARRTFRPKEAGLTGRSIHGPKLKAAMNKIVAPATWKDRFWEFADTLSLDLLDEAGVPESFDRAGAGRALELIQDALIAAHLGDDREGFYRALFRKANASVDQAPSINDKAGPVEESWDKRLGRVRRILAKSPAVFLKGSPGTGKSFAAKGLADALGLRMFGPVTIGVDAQEQDSNDDETGRASAFADITRWALHDGPALLVLDEANLARPDFWRFFGGLFVGEGETPYMWIEGRKIDMEGKKVVFTGNQETLQDRKYQDFLAPHVPTVAFPEFDEAFFRQRLEEYVSPDAPNAAALRALLLGVFETVRRVAGWEEGQGISLRDLQELSARAQVLSGSGNIVEEALLAAWEMFSPSLSPEGRVALRHALRLKFAVDAEALQNAWIEDLRNEGAQLYRSRALTLSRTTMRLAAAVGDFLIMREYRMKRNGLAAGKRGMILEGASGRGKDVTVVRVLESSGYEAVKAGAAAPGPRSFCHINASPRFDELEKAIVWAKENGVVLVVSELDVLPSGYLEGKLNDVLTDDNTDAKGFAFIATINGADFSGRERLSTALQNRVIFRREMDYDKDDLSEYALDIVTEFGTKAPALSDEDMAYIVRAHLWIQNALPRSRERPTPREFKRALLVAASGVSAEEAVERVYGPIYLRRMLRGQELPGRKALASLEFRSGLDKVKAIGRIAQFILPVHQRPVTISLKPAGQSAAGTYKAQKVDIAFREDQFDGQDWLNTLEHEAGHGLFTRDFAGLTPTSAPDFFLSLAGLQAPADPFEDVYQDLEDLRHKRAMRQHFPGSITQDNDHESVYFQRDLERGIAGDWKGLFSLAPKKIFQLALIAYGRKEISRTQLEAAASAWLERYGEVNLNPFALALRHLDVVDEIFQNGIPETLEEDEILYRQYLALKAMQRIKLDGEFLSLGAVPVRSPKEKSVLPRPGSVDVGKVLGRIGEVDLSGPPREMEERAVPEEPLEDVVEDLQDQRNEILKSLSDELGLMEDDLPLASEERLREIIAQLTDNKAPRSILTALGFLGDKDLTARKAKILAIAQAKLKSNKAPAGSRFRMRRLALAAGVLLASGILALLVVHANSGSSALPAMIPRIPEPELLRGMPNYLPLVIIVGLSLLASMVYGGIKLSAARAEGVSTEDSRLTRFLGFLGRIRISQMGRLAGLFGRVASETVGSRYDGIEGAHESKARDDNNDVQISESVSARPVPSVLSEESRYSKMKELSTTVSSLLDAEASAFVQRRATPGREFGPPGTGTLYLPKFLRNPLRGFRRGGMPTASTRPPLLVHGLPANGGNLIAGEFVHFLKDRGFEVVVVSGTLDEPQAAAYLKEAPYIIMSARELQSRVEAAYIYAVARRDRERAPVLKEAPVDSVYPDNVLDASGHFPTIEEQRRILVETFGENQVRLLLHGNLGLTLDRDYEVSWDALWKKCPSIESIIIREDGPSDLRIFNGLRGLRTIFIPPGKFSDDDVGLFFGNENDPMRIVVHVWDEEIVRQSYSASTFTPGLSNENLISEMEEACREFVPPHLTRDIYVRLGVSRKYEIKPTKVATVPDLMKMTEYSRRASILIFVDHDQFTDADMARIVLSAPFPEGVSIEEIQEIIMQGETPRFMDYSKAVAYCRAHPEEFTVTLPGATPPAAQRTVQPADTPDPFPAIEEQREALIDIFGPEKVKVDRNGDLELTVDDRDLFPYRECESLWKHCPSIRTIIVGENGTLSINFYEGIRGLRNIQLPAGRFHRVELERFYREAENSGRIRIYSDNPSGGMKWFSAADFIPGSGFKEVRAIIREKLGRHNMMSSVTAEFMQDMWQLRIRLSQGLGVDELRVLTGFSEMREVFLMSEGFQIDEFFMTFFILTSPVPENVHFIFSSDEGESRSMSYSEAVAYYRAHPKQFSLMALPGTTPPAAQRTVQPADTPDPFPTIEEQRRILVDTFGENQVHLRDDGPLELMLDRDYAVSWDVLWRKCPSIESIIIKEDGPSDLRVFSGLRGLKTMSIPEGKFRKKDIRSFYQDYSPAPKAFIAEISRSGKGKKTYRMDHIFPSYNDSVIAAELSNDLKAIVGPAAANESSIHPSSFGEFTFFVGASIKGSDMLKMVQYLNVRNLKIVIEEGQFSEAVLSRIILSSPRPEAVKIGFFKSFRTIAYPEAVAYRRAHPEEFADMGPIATPAPAAEDRFPTLESQVTRARDLFGPSATVEKNVFGLLVNVGQRQEPLEGMGSLPSLGILHLEASRVKDLSPLFGLRALHKVFVSDGQFPEAMIVNLFLHHPNPKDLIVDSGSKQYDHAWALSGKFGEPTNPTEEMMGTLRGLMRSLSKEETRVEDNSSVISINLEGLSEWLIIHRVLNELTTGITVPCTIKVNAAFPKKAMLDFILKCRVPEYVQVYFVGDDGKVSDIMGYEDAAKAYSSRERDAQSEPTAHGPRSELLNRLLETLVDRSAALKKVRDWFEAEGESDAYDRLFEDIERRAVSRETWRQGLWAAALFGVAAAAFLVSAQFLAASFGFAASSLGAAAAWPLAGLVLMGILRLVLAAAARSGAAYETPDGRAPPLFGFRSVRVEPGVDLLEFEKNTHALVLNPSLAHFVYHSNPVFKVLSRAGLYILGVPGHEALHGLGVVSERWAYFAAQVLPVSLGFLAGSLAGGVAGGIVLAMVFSALLSAAFRAILSARQDSVSEVSVVPVPVAVDDSWHVKESGFRDRARVWLRGIAPARNFGVDALGLPRIHIRLASNAFVDGTPDPAALRGALTKGLARESARGGDRGAAYVLGRALESLGDNAPGDAWSPRGHETFRSDILAAYAGRVVFTKVSARMRGGKDVFAEVPADVMKKGAARASVSGLLAAFVANNAGTAGDTANTLTLIVRDPRQASPDFWQGMSADAAFNAGRDREEFMRDYDVLLRQGNIRIILAGERPSLIASARAEVSLLDGAILRMDRLLSALEKAGQLDPKNAVIFASDQVELGVYKDVVVLVPIFRLVESLQEGLKALGLFLTSA